MELQSTLSRSFPVLIAGALLSVAGCGSQPERVIVPKYNPNAFAKSLIERCDADASGTISKQEATRAPGLVANFSRYDTDGDSAISQAELAARAQLWADRGDGLVSIRCVVKQNGRQLKNVTVKLIPDESLEGVIQPAETVSHEARASSLSIPPELKSEAHQKLTGMQYGLYRIEVSHPDMTLVPAADSAGCDISPEDQASSVVIKVTKP